MISEMSLENAKLVLSGGNGKLPFFESVYDLSQTEQPRCAIDLSAKASQHAFDEARKAWAWALDKHGLPEPAWLQDTYEQGLDKNITARFLDAADVLLVAGGSTRRAYKAWQNSNVTKQILQKVIDGDIVAAGGSAGAMIWFTNGYSDSNQFDVATGDFWDYTLIETTGVIPAWVNVHHSDVDAFGRLRSEGFAALLDDRAGEWKSAVGIDTNAALICRNGVARVKDLSTTETNGPHNVYMYSSSTSTPIVLQAGDALGLNNI